MKSMCAGLLLGVSVVGGGAAAPTSFTPLGDEASLLGPLAGDQVFPQASVDAFGGYAVWQDSLVDGDDFGIEAVWLDGSLLTPFAPFQVNASSAGVQELPQVSLLHDGGAVFVWQTTVGIDTDIVARFLSADRVFVTGDVRVNSTTVDVQKEPAVTVLDNGNVVITWSSYGQDGSMDGIYARLFSPSGEALSDEIAVNQTTEYNQRDAKVTSLPDGGFAVCWISEALPIRTPNGTVDGETVYSGVVNQVHLFARVYSATGAPQGGQFRVSPSNQIASAPVVSGTSSGNLTFAWTERNEQNAAENYDIYLRTHSVSGAPVSDAVRVNTTVFGPQYAPSISTLGNDHLVVWTSLQQDGSLEGVYGRFVSAAGSFLGEEIGVNVIQTASKQMHPTVATDRSGNVLVIWTSYEAGSSFDLQVKRFHANREVPIPQAPYVSPLGGGALSVTWPALSGYAGVSYLLYMDGSETATYELSQTHLTVGDLQPGSVHSFRLAYRLGDGRVSPLSAARSATVWTADVDGDGIPDNWQTTYWGAPWPAAGADSDGDGATNFEEFLAGTNPLDPNSVLKAAVIKDAASMKLEWVGARGASYRVEKSTDLKFWESVGEVMAVEPSVKIDVPQGETAFYRVILLR